MEQNPPGHPIGKTSIVPNEQDLWIETIVLQVIQSHLEKSSLTKFKTYEVSGTIWITEQARLMKE